MHVYLLEVFLIAFVDTLVCILAHYSPIGQWYSVKLLPELFIMSSTYTSMYVHLTTLMSGLFLHH